MELADHIHGCLGLAFQDDKPLFYRVCCTAKLRKFFVGLLSQASSPVTYLKGLRLDWTVLEEEGYDLQLTCL